MSTMKNLTPREDIPNCHAQNNLQKRKQLDLGHLKTVMWIKDRQITKDIYSYCEPKYRELKNLIVISWIIATIELALITFWTFIHSLNWPDWFVNILEIVDKIIEKILEFIGSTIEWWYDNVSIRLMWARDVFEEKADEALTKADEQIDKVVTRCDFIFIFFQKKYSYVKKYIEWIKSQYEDAYKEMTTPINYNKPDLQQKTIHLGSSDSIVYQTTDDEKYETEERSEDEILSDISDIANGRRSNITQNRSTIKHKMAMEQRVTTHLKLMRKHSIKFSNDLLSIANSIVSPTMLPITNKILRFTFDIGKKLGIPELIAKLQVFIKRFPLIARPLALLWLVWKTPVKIFYNYILKKKTYKRSRSRRSESFRRRALAKVCERKLETISPAVLRQSSEPTSSTSVLYQRKGTNLALLDIHSEEIRLPDSGLSSGTDDLFYSDSGLKQHRRGSNELDDILEEQVDDSDNLTYQRHINTNRIRPYSEGRRCFKKSISSPCFLSDTSDNYNFRKKSPKTNIFRDEEIKEDYTKFIQISPSIRNENSDWSKHGNKSLTKTVKFTQE